MLWVLVLFSAVSGGAAAAAASITRLPASAQAGATPNSVLRFDNANRILDSQAEKGYRVSTWEVMDQFLIRRQFLAPFYNEDFYSSDGEIGSSSNEDTSNGPRDDWDILYEYGSLTVFQWLPQSNSWADRGIFISSKLPLASNPYFGQDFCVVADRFLVTTSASFRSDLGVAALIFDMDRETMDRYVTPVQIFDSGSNETGAWAELGGDYSVKRVAINECTSSGFTMNGRTFTYSSGSDQFTDSGMNAAFSSDETIMVSIFDTIGGDFDRRFANARTVKFGEEILAITMDRDNLYISRPESADVSQVTFEGQYCHAYSLGDRLILSKPWSFVDGDTPYAKPSFWELTWDNFKNEIYTLTDISTDLGRYSFGTTGSSILSNPALSTFYTRDHFGNVINSTVSSGCDFVVDYNQLTGSLVIVSELGHLQEMHDLTESYKDSLQYGRSTYTMNFDTANASQSSLASTALEAQGMYVVKADSSAAVAMYHTTLQYEGLLLDSTSSGGNLNLYYGRYAPDFASPMLLGKTSSSEVLLTSNNGKLHIWATAADHAGPLETYILGEDDASQYVAHLSFNSYRETSWTHANLMCKTMHTDVAEELLNSSDDNGVFMANKGPGFMDSGSACGPFACAFADGGLEVYCRNYTDSSFMLPAVPLSKINDTLAVVENSHSAWILEV